MTVNKDFKRLVRARMQKTGESFTSARATLTLARSVPPSRPAALTPDYAKLAGMSDAAIKKATGCEWSKWVFVLDKVQAYEWPHRQITEYVNEKYKTGNWWTQGVATGYERIKGLRAIGQRRGGGFEASRSRTFAVPAGKLFTAWSNARTRARWLPGIKLKIRTSQPGKSMRITWPDDTHVDLWFTAKGAGKTALAVTHKKLADKAVADEWKAYWGERLAALGEMLVPVSKEGGRAVGR